MTVVPFGKLIKPMRQKRLRNTDSRMEDSA